MALKAVKVKSYIKHQVELSDVITAIKRQNKNFNNRKTAHYGKNTYADDFLREHIFYSKKLLEIPLKTTVSFN
jgi:hypothetical protein